MNKHLSHRIVRRAVATLAAFAGAACVGQADVIETLGGSVIQGKILAAEGGVVKIETDFAGVVEIKQAQVKSLVTEAPVYVALEDGNTARGRIERTGAGLVVGTSGGAVQLQTGAITHIWREGDKSPADKAADALRRKWAYVLGFDLNGKQGNSDRFFTGVSASATMTGQTDRLRFYGNYSRAEDNGVATQDEGKAGVDFTSYFSGKMSWYVRSELGFDRSKNLDLRSQSAVGVGYTFIKKDNQMLEGRAGLGYRFENYSTGTDFDSVGLDFGLLHSYVFTWGKMANSLSYTPSFDDFGNFVLTHESTLDIPIAASKVWRVRVGVKNDYTSDPPAGLKKHDWGYFSSLVFTWQ
jgi:hypothetical protein